MSYTPPPLDYSVPRGGRPGIVTAIGVISIVVGCLSALTALWRVLTYGAMLFFTQLAPALAAPPAATMPATAPATAPNSVVLPTVTATTGSWTATSTSTTAGGVTTTTVTTGPVNSFGGMSRGALVLVVSTSLIGLSLAIGLIVLGALVLRESRRALVLHWWYVRIKIPLVLIASAGSLWMTWTMVNGMTIMTATTPGAAGTPPPAPMSNAMMFRMMSISTAFSAAIALAYPIALIFVLRGRTVRDYMTAVRE